MNTTDTTIRLEVIVDAEQPSCGNVWVKRQTTIADVIFSDIGSGKCSLQDLIKATMNVMRQSLNVEMVTLNLYQYKGTNFRFDALIKSARFILRDEFNFRWSEFNGHVYDQWIALDDITQATKKIRMLITEYVNDANLRMREAQNTAQSEMVG